MGKKKILIISCYGYGNLGDNMYSEVFDYFLGDCEIVKLSDYSMFVDSKKNFKKKAPVLLTDNYEFDMLIIGGGGIILPGKLDKSHNLPYYINIAKMKNIPLCIISCGIQGYIENDKWKDISCLDSWRDTLNYASLITVRSKKDLEIIRNLTYNKNIFYFRDLGYIYPHISGVIDRKDPKEKKKKSGIVTLIVAGPIYPSNKDVINILYDKKYKFHTVNIVNMGSRNSDDNAKKISEINLEGMNVIKFYGCGIAEEFNFENKSNPSDIDLHMLIKIIQNSDLVLTGRYHGMIFARSLGVDYDTLGMGTNKILWEEDVNSVSTAVTNSYNHIKKIRDILKLENKNVENYTNVRSSVRKINEFKPNKVSILIIIIFFIVLFFIICCLETSVLFV